MISFGETSFLCALYRTQDNSGEADSFMAARSGPIAVTSLVLWEFRQSVRLQVYRFTQDRTQGFSTREAEGILASLAANLKAGAFTLKSADWPRVHQLAEDLSRQYTSTHGHRAMDILHVASALHLEAEEFLTFDQKQGSLAAAIGIKTPLAAALRPKK
jgi:predicted nucleic acid-binding protein